VSQLASDEGTDCSWLAPHNAGARESIKCSGACYNDGMHSHLACAKQVRDLLPTS